MNSQRAKKLLISLGEISDTLIEEANSAGIAARVATRKRIVKYSAIGAGAAASVGVAVTCLVLYSKKRARISL